MRTLVCLLTLLVAISCDGEDRVDIPSPRGSPSVYHCGCKTGTKKVDLGLLIDASGSTSFYGNWYKMLQMARVVISRLCLNHINVGLVRYGTSPQTEVPLGAYNTSYLIHRIDKLMPPRGHAKTHTNIGLDHVREKLFKTDGDREGIKNVLVVFTDGEIMGDHPESAVNASAKILQGEGVLIIALGVFPAYDEDLQLLAKPEHITRAKDFLGMRSSFVADLIQKYGQ